MNAERADPRFELEGRRVWVAGHRGMVGGALLARLGAVDKFQAVLTQAGGEG